MTTEAKTVKLSELDVDEANVRKTGRGKEPKFAAIIRARGVIEPMIVRRGTREDEYWIVNGGERFTARLHLKKKGEKANGVAITDDFPAQVRFLFNRPTFCVGAGYCAKPGRPVICPRLLGGVIGGIFWPVVVFKMLFGPLPWRR